MNFQKHLSVSWQTKSFVAGSRFVFLYGFLILSILFCAVSVRDWIEIFSKGALKVFWLQFVPAIVWFGLSILFAFHAATIIIRNRNTLALEGDLVVFRPQHFDFIRCFSNKPPGEGSVHALGFNQAFRTLRTNAKEFFICSVDKKNSIIQLKFGERMFPLQYFGSEEDFQSVLNFCLGIKRMDCG
jgi:hypothetical protein